MSPIIFDTSFFTIYSLWVFFAIAVIVGTYILIRLAIHEGLKLQFLSDNTAKLILLSLVGGRIIHIALNVNSYFYEFSTNTLLRFFYIWDKGINFWAAVVIFAVYFIYLCKKNEQNFLKWMDVILPAAIIAIGIFNLGAFFEGINYGKPTSLPWGVNFENPAIKYSVPIHPTQIYSFLYSIFIGVILILIKNIQKIKQMEKPGLIGMIGLTSYYFARFAEEFLRGDDTYMIFDIRLTQIIIFFLFATTGIILYLKFFDHRKKRKSKTAHSLHLK